jgi:hypothetical protein
MSYSNLVHLKPLLMVLTAVAGTVTGGVMLNSFQSSFKDPGTFLLTLNPSSMMLLPNATSASTITVTGIDGFSGTVTLSLFFPGTTFTASISPTSVSVPLNSVATSTLSITAPNTLGTYSVVVIGVSSIHGKTAYSSSMLTVQVVSSQDFTITSTPASITTTTGTTNTTTITVTSVNGYAGNISLTVTASFGYISVTGGQNPLKIVAGGAASSTLDITTSSNTAPGSYSIIVTGSDGSQTHSTTITLQIVDPPVIIESLALNSYHFNNSTSLTLFLQNTGNGTIMLQSYVIQDSSGDAWSLTSWAGPSIAVNGVGSANILIGSSCPSCIYTGITGLFFQFQAGQTYTVTVTTSRNNQFTFTVVD